MSENLKATAVGFALMDLKLFKNTGTISIQTNIPSYIESAGGSVANTMSAFKKYSGLPARLHYAVANDRLGNRFISQTAQYLGAPQIREGNSGFCLMSIGPEGEIMDEVTSYGVSSTVLITDHEKANSKSDMVISNVNSLRHASIYDQTVHLLDNLDKKKGIFAFRLSGAHDLFATGTEAREVIDSLPKQPDIVFGNDEEMKNLGETQDGSQALSKILPDTRIFVMTRGAREVLIRFEDTVYTLPTVKAENVVDVTGAGDHLMGVALGSLALKTYGEWTQSDVINSVFLGALAASRVIQTPESRLTHTELEEVLYKEVA